MPFAYYKRLNPAQKAIYRRSDAVSSIRLSRPETLRHWVPELANALRQEDRRAAEAIGQQLTDGILSQLGTAPVQVLVRDVRPHDDYGELHGLYEPGEPPYRSRLTLWMRTAQRAEVVAFRTFLRTLLHELCHHLDYELLQLEETFHTEGFYRRESSLFHQLVPRSTAE